jgi:transcriptional regulator with XRE-family HTH domain
VPLSSSAHHSRRSLHTIEGRRFFDPLIDQLIHARKRRGLRQEDVNERIGCAERLVSKWECREKYPSSYFLVLWAQALDVKLTVQMEDQ